MIIICMLFAPSANVIKPYSPSSLEDFAFRLTDVFSLGCFVVVGISTPPGRAQRSEQSKTDEMAQTIRTVLGRLKELRSGRRAAVVGLTVVMIEGSD